jgi:C1A family cysteine protease
MKFGWIPESPNPKDFKFEDFKPQLSKVGASVSSKYIIPIHTPTYNQLSLSSCVANATVGALEILMGLQGKITFLSRLFVYWNARVATQDTDKDQGTYIRNAFASLQKLGVCLESTWSYDERNVFSQPPIQAYKEGNDNSIESFYKIFSTGNQKLNDIEYAVRSNHPVVFGTPISDELLNYSDARQTLSIPSANIIGGHAMIIVGVRTNSDGTRDFLVRNSWSDNWGANGHAWFSDNYIMWDQTTDLWVPTLIPQLVV